MHQDAIDLKEFYYANSLGRAVRRLLQARIRQRWPNLGGERLLGLGFAAPFLRLFNDEATHLACAMPAEQGVIPWPPEGPFVSCLSHDSLLPFPDASFDRVAAVHSIEHTVSLPALLSETWRVMTDQAKLIVIVPNRRSIWARSEKTPFGHGKPFSRMQLKNTLQDHGFNADYMSEALFLPPLNSAAVLRSVPSLEKIGRRLLPTFGGALIAEASKEHFKPVKAKRYATRLEFVPAALGQRPVAQQQRHD